MPTGLSGRLDLYKEQHRGEVANHFGRKAAAERTSSRSNADFGSDFALLSVRQNITTDYLGSSSVSLETNLAALLHPSKP